MDVYVGRQPILGKDKKIFGYELLFRDGLSNVFSGIDGETATSKVLSNSFLSIGIQEITAGAPAFINFPEAFIVRKIPFIFSPKILVVEILEDVAPTADVVDRCRELSGRGYPIALDDFCYRPEYRALLPHADIVKLDFRAQDPDALRETVRQLKAFRPDLLAEKVETYDEFQAALDMGFSYFQGYFFSKPEVLSGKDISVPKMNLLGIMSEANKENFEFNRLEKIISRELGLSYKLLRYVNSAFFKRRESISSIKQAIVLLGEKKIRQFISLIAMSNLAQDKPNELIRNSVIRAKFCELAGGLDGGRANLDELFTLGLFSLIDAVMDDSMESLMQKLPLSDAIKEALISGAGTLGEYLKLAVGYEKADWKAVSSTASRLGLREEGLPNSFMEALSWANSFSEF
ncbi:MAG: HDOD domain-containing protein [Desulfobacteraceae bacterium]|nr:MAG: HDOD domain-containing protein [Desulfobacteraceae bacterium]